MGSGTATQDTSGNHESDDWSSSGLANPVHSLLNGDSAGGRKFNLRNSRIVTWSGTGREYLSRDRLFGGNVCSCGFQMDPTFPTRGGRSVLSEKNASYLAVTAQHDWWRTTMSERLPRRDFAQQLGWGAASFSWLQFAPTADAVAGARKSLPGNMPETTLLAAADDKPLAAASEEKPSATPVDQATEEELLFALAKKRFGHEKWDEAASEEVRAEIARHVSRGRMLTRLALKNGEAPSGPFRAYRAGDS